MFIKRLTHRFVVSVLIALTIMGQTPTLPPQEIEPREQKKQDLRATANEQAYELLDAVVKDTQRLRLSQNRAYLYAVVGDLLWDHDKQGARALFKDAAADLLGFLNEPLDVGSAPSNRQRMERSTLREKILFVLAKHDARLTLDLLAETRPVSTPQDEAAANGEAELETRLAAVIAENDPSHAIEMARKSLAKGINSSLPTLLSEIREKDEGAAAELAKDILSMLKSATLATNLEAANVAIKIFMMATSRPDSGAKSITKDAKPLLSEDSLRELAELIAAAVLSPMQEGSGRTINIASIMTELEKYAPSRVQQLRRINPPSISDGDGGDGDQSYQNYRKLVETGSAEALIAAADKAGPGLSDSYYREAVSKLVAEDKIDQARQVITEHISNPEVRQQMLADLDKQQLLAAASKGKMEETRKLIPTANTNEERIAILTQLATAIAEKGDKKVALQILDEARSLSTGRTRYSRQMLARLQIAHAYAPIDQAQSLTILEPIIDQLNELIGAGIILGEFFGEEEFVRDDEVLILFVSQLVEMFQQQFGKELALLALSDFARTRDAADRFQRFEVRIMARFLVAQSVLTKEVKMPDELPTATEGPKTVPVSP